MIKLAYTEHPVILQDFINAYHKEPLVFDNIRDMFKFIEAKTGLDSTFFIISWSGGSDERFKCEKDPVGFLTWRELRTYDPVKHREVIVAYIDLGDRNEKDIHEKQMEVIKNDYI